jgi:hypothetical protein
VAKHLLESSDIYAVTDSINRERMAKRMWVFLLPPALLVLDSFRSKNGLVFCVLILITYLFYPMQWPKLLAVFVSYHIPALLITGLWFQWVFTVLAGLLLFWVFALSKELSDEEATSRAT